MSKRGFAETSQEAYIPDVDTSPPRAIAKVFRSGNSQAVRLPKEFRVDVEELEITRVDDALILRPRKRTMTEFLELLYALPEDMFEGIKDERLPEEREGL